MPGNKKYGSVTIFRRESSISVQNVSFLCHQMASESCGKRIGHTSGHNNNIPITSYEEIEGSFSQSKSCALSIFRLTDWDLQFYTGSERDNFY